MAPTSGLRGETRLAGDDYGAEWRWDDAPLVIWMVSLRPTGPLPILDVDQPIIAGVNGPAAGGYP